MGTANEKPGRSIRCERSRHECQWNSGHPLICWPTASDIVMYGTRCKVQEHLCKSFTHWIMSEGPYFLVVSRLGGFGVIEVPESGRHHAHTFSDRVCNEMVCPSSKLSRSFEGIKKIQSVAKDSMKWPQSMINSWRYAMGPSGFFRDVSFTDAVAHF